MIFDNDFDENGVWKKLINEIFSLDPEHYSDLDNIYVDLDSCLSILTNPRVNVNDKSVLDDLINHSVITIANFLDKWKNYSNIRIYINFKPTRLINEYIPEWDSERNERLKSKVLSRISKDIVFKLKKITLHNIKIEEIDDSPILFITKKIMNSTIKGERSIILSRDKHYLCLFYFLNELEIFDGTRVINSRNYIKIEDYEYSKVHPVMLPYYCAFVGLSRHQYKGIHKFGKLRGYKLLKNIDVCKSILNGDYELLKELGDKIKVFTIKELIKEI